MDMNRVLDKIDEASTEDGAVLGVGILVDDRWELFVEIEGPKNVMTDAETQQSAKSVCQILIRALGEYLERREEVQIMLWGQCGTSVACKAVGSGAWVVRNEAGTVRSGTATDTENMAGAADLCVASTDDFYKAIRGSMVLVQAMELLLRIPSMAEARVPDASDLVGKMESAMDVTSDEVVFPVPAGDDSVVYVSVNGTVTNVVVPAAVVAQAGEDDVFSSHLLSRLIHVTKDMVPGNMLLFVLKVPRQLAATPVVPFCVVSLDTVSGILGMRAPAMPDSDQKTRETFKNLGKGLAMAVADLYQNRDFFAGINLKP